MSFSQTRQNSKSAEQSTSYTPEQRTWLSKALALYGPSMGTGENIYPGTTVAPMTGAQQRVLGNLENYTDVFNADRGMPMYAETGQALGDILAGKRGAEYITPTATEQYYQTNIKQPAQYQWMTETAPGIKEQYAGPGYWSSARAGAVTKSGTELQNWLGEQKGALDWQTLQENRATEEARANRTAAAIPQGMQYGQMPTQEATNKVSALQNVFGGLSATQSQQQAEIDAAINKFQQGERTTPEEDMAIMLALLGMNYSSSSGWSRSGLRSWAMA